jgi:hypothetical protein
MADDYIDYWEVGEYAAHFLNASKQLVGASKLVDMEEVRTLVQHGADRVAVELQKTGIQRSARRRGGGTVEEANDAARKDVEKFHNYLNSLDDDLPLDRAAFFPGDKLGPISTFKPADMKAKLDEVLRGFAVPSHHGLPDRNKWKKRLEAARDGLADAIAGKSGARGASVQATTQLVQGREEFLGVYNGVAKPLVRGLLAHLGRKDEYNQFFADLLVNESGAATPGTPAPAPTPN